MNKTSCLNIKVEGNIPSKKNSKRIVFSKSRNRPFLISQKNYLDWHTYALKTLKIERTEALGLQSTIRINLHISPPNKRKYDLTNKAESVMDLLVDYGVIADDNAQVVPELLLLAKPPSEKGYFEVEIFY
jgi:Holliday junction resolvase RusA-like endonuclease